MAVILGLLHLGRNRLTVVENRILRKAFGPNGEEVIEGYKKLHNVRTFKTCTLHQILLRLANEGL
jgi:hypothetical protein